MRLNSFPLPGIFRAIISALAAAAMLAACAPSNTKRSTGTVIDDQAIEVTVLNNLFETAEISDADHIKIEVHNGTVLLVGETQSEANKALATKIAREVRGVTHVVNELAVMPAAGLGSRLDNSYVTTKANSILTAKNPVAGMDMTRIKVITARSTVYLMGTVTQKAGAQVGDVVRNIGGVVKVVKVFDYVD